MKGVRSVSGVAAVVAAVGVFSSVALAYYQQPPATVAPPPPVNAGSVQNSVAPQPVTQQPVQPSQSTNFGYTLPSSNPQTAISINVKVLPKSFTQGGTVTLQVPSNTNLQSLQNTFGNTEKVVGAFVLQSSAPSKKPEIITLNDPSGTEKFGVYAIRKNGTGTGYHYVRVEAKMVGNNWVFPANRNETYVLVAVPQNSNSSSSSSSSSSAG